MWCEGTVEGVYRRHSLKTRSWERAEELKRAIEDGERDAPQAAPIPTLKEATAKFLADAEHGRKLTAGTLKKYRVLLAQLASFAGSRAANELKDIDVDFAASSAPHGKTDPYRASRSSNGSARSADSA